MNTTTDQFVMTIGPQYVTASSDRMEAGSIPDPYNNSANFTQDNYVNTNPRHQYSDQRAQTQVAYTTTSVACTAFIHDSPSTSKPYIDKNSTMYQNLEMGPHKETPIIYNITKNINLKSWNIKFSGDSCVNEFLNQVEEIRSARDVDISVVVRGFSEFLQGTALKFYRSIKHTLHSWTDICQEFTRNFQSIDFEYSTEKTIRETKQKENQSVFAFIIDLKDLNYRLSKPISEESLLEIVKHNLLPKYAPLLANNFINSFEHLISASKNFEAYSHTTQNHTNTTNQHNEDRNKNITNTQLTTRNTHTHPNFSRKKPEINYTHPVNQNQFNTQNRSSNQNFLTCEKCKKRGHTSNQCRTIPEMMCFRCGRRNVHTSNCPNCKKQSYTKNYNSYNQKN